MNKVKMLILIFLFSTSVANANIVEDKILMVKNWAANEKAETIEFQKKGWADGKAQLNKTWNDIKNLFNWSK